MGKPDREAGMRTSRRGVLRLGVALLSSTALAACTSGSFDRLGVETPGGPGPAPGAEPQPGAAIGTGQVRVGLILPMSAPGNAGIAATSMRNAAELAITEFKNPDLQLLVKDDGGTPQGAQTAVQQALAEGARIIVGPIFAQSVSAVAPIARQSNVPIIAFSTDTNVAARGVYLLSFLPESDVHRIIDFSITRGKRSFAALIPDNAYGTVVEAAFQQAAARRGGRVVALERYPADPARRQEAIRRIAAAARRADAIFIPDNAETVPQIVQGLGGAGANLRRVQLIGTGLWDEPSLFANPSMNGGWFAAPGAEGFRNFSQRYRARYGQEPVRTSSLAYDAVALIAALVKTQGPQSLNDQTLTNASGFAGIDGVFRFRADGTNERGLAVMEIKPSGSVVISQPPRSFGS
jgi:ABC-type branched-subunit amino acid transport system substrate-binding protein